MIAWLLHRISAIGIVVFVSMHIWAAFFLYAVEGTTGSIAKRAHRLLRALPMQILVLFCVLYHAINGLRIVVLDMWPRLPVQPRAMWVQWAIFLPLFLLPAVLMITGGH